MQRGIDTEKVVLHFARLLNEWSSQTRKDVIVSQTDAAFE
jgi:hypothetical protein